ncbi:GDP-mannose 4,6 dehydratase [Albimonas donghaensis]|uniref:GDP-mannose 4,6 dehydratase n=1 Tax=Albimonas donghaensis TaxID=356660 RepID=A0A1H2VYL7_9RHOB|nr:GDP-mannose 4,6-dehydratase [Albimonas donghaensis]SDW73522.1 GDP-mannose 4,6 dehydratase [Albimonas donghaensis]
MKLLVTGGAGFIGSATIRHAMRDRGLSVVNVDKLTYAATPEALEDCADSPNYTLVQADIAEKTNIEVVRFICAWMDDRYPEAGAHEDLIEFVTDRPGHDLRYAIDPTRIRDELGWAPRETFETGMDRTLAWFMDNEPWWRAIRAGRYDGKRLGSK